ncbi:ABC transporter permease [Novilysobacter defluvii]|uniref:ABC transporter permease n=1 Tax=Lysobacter defluvii IMMIB APB-9 = DSM 18482 TaxID=1385515 RepID=A0A0A0MBL1_9GAMM|nr:MlaE family lipid ABC transporter permease subunit [Lysobacter defluvii]KGO99797.1 ABC transporter permease [Lysobacter defluvii IMMIB APB-9 = DSM 18482]
MSERDPQPRIEAGQPDGTVRLLGAWTLAEAEGIRRALEEAPDDARQVDASGVARLDSLGVLQLLRFARKRKLDFAGFRFSDEHGPLVAAIGDVADDRPPKKREYGVADALARLGKAMYRNGQEVLALVAFLGEVLVKMTRLVREPRRLRATSTVYHMEQVGLDAVPLVFLLCFLVGAVIAFLGANVLRDFGATQFVVELVSISFLREFAVLLTAIILAGRTASAFTAHIGSMVSREEVDAIRALGLDPIDLLVIPRISALLVMLPLLTFLGMIAGLLGGLVVGVFGLDIAPQQYLGRMQNTMDLKHMWVGLSKAPVFAMLIGLIGCLEGMQVTGTAQSVGERTTSSVVQSISVVIILDAFAAMWFMEMGW